MKTYLNYLIHNWVADWKKDWRYYLHLIAVVSSAPCLITGIFWAPSIGLILSLPLVFMGLIGCTLLLVFDDLKNSYANYQQWKSNEIWHENNQKERSDSSQLKGESE